MVVSRRLCVYGTVAITTYVDPSVEPTDWRHSLALRARTERRAVRVQPETEAMQEGVAQGLYSNRYPFVLPGGHAYAARWGFTIVESVLQGGQDWGETESEEEGTGSSDVREPPA